MSSYTLFNIKEFFNLSPRLDGWLNPQKLYCTVTHNTKSVSILMTDRAKNQLINSEHELYIELQLLFSCTLKKHIVFHQHPERHFEKLCDKINVCFRKIQPTACDPSEFAANYTEKRELNAKAVEKVFPKSIQIDYVSNQWVADYELK